MNSQRPLLQRSPGRVLGVGRGVSRQHGRPPHGRVAGAPVEGTIPLPAGRGVSVARAKTKFMSEGGGIRRHGVVGVNSGYFSETNKVSWVYPRPLSRLSQLGGGPFEVGVRRPVSLSSAREHGVHIRVPPRSGTPRESGSRDLAADLQKASRIPPWGIAARRGVNPRYSLVERRIS